MAETRQQGPGATPAAGGRLRGMRGYRASLFAVLVATLWLLLVLPQALTGAPPSDAVYATSRSLLPRRLSEVWPVSPSI